MFRKVFGYCYDCRRWFVYPKVREIKILGEEDIKVKVYCCKKCYKKHEINLNEAYREIFGD